MTRPPSPGDLPHGGWPGKALAAHGKGDDALESIPPKPEFRPCRVSSEAGLYPDHPKSQGLPAGGATDGDEEVGMKATFLSTPRTPPCCDRGAITTLNRRLDLSPQAG